jgi:diacylglycerol kinase
LGLGHAILCAKHIINNEPFAVLLADELILSDTGAGCLSEMVRLYDETQSSLVAVDVVPYSKTHQYGIVSTQLDGSVHRISSIIEKPLPEDAPSNLAVIGRYIFNPSIVHELENALPQANGEIGLTEAISLRLEKERFLSYHLKGKRFDCGCKIGYVQAIVHVGLTHPEIGNSVQSYLTMLSQASTPDPSPNKTLAQCRSHKSILISSITKLTANFKNSLNGIKQAFINEWAFRAELILICIAIPAAWLLSNQTIERMLMINAVLLLPVVELLNTAIETTVNRIGAEYNKLSGLAKDLGSAALLAAVVNMIITWGIVLCSRYG